VTQDNWYDEVHNKSDDVIRSHDNEDSSLSHNPATGLPMLSGCFDVGGNFFSL